MRIREMYLLLLCSSFYFSEVAGQGGNNTFKLPEILPPSPDVAALSKGAELSSTPHTGGANASIPVYQIKAGGGFALPVSINYSANGFKPEEIPSRVGINWSLSAGGSVSRIVRGKPDDYSTSPSTYLTQSQVIAYTSNAYYFITDLADQESDHDGMPDEYRYNVNGLSGKFIIKRNGQVLQIPYNNVKISVSKNSGGAVTDIYIVDSKGIKYTFGEGQVETTIQHNLVYNLLEKQNITTAWMLTKIVYPNNNYLDFSYGSLNHYVQSGTMQSVRKGIVGEYCMPPPPATNVSCPVGAEYSSKSSLIRYTSRYLTHINASTGTSLAIIYADRPDAGGDNRVDYITVYNSNNTAVKKIQLEYLDRHNPTNTPNNEGFFLKKVVIKDPTNNSTEQQSFELSYVDEANTAVGVIGANNGIDHLGFANGANNASLLPVTSTYVYSGVPLFANEGNADRGPHGSFAQKGMLQKITYPTDGYDEFYYEPNMKIWYDSADVINIKSARAAGTGLSSNYPVYTTYFTPGRNCAAEFYLKADWNNTSPEPSGNPAPKTAYAYLYVNSTNQLKAMRRVEGHQTGSGYMVYGDLNITGGLSGGVEYKLELEVRYGSNVTAQADIVYDAGAGKVWKQFNEELCGVRVRKVLSYDPVSRKSSSKFYSYRGFIDTLTPSANKLYYPQYVTAYSQGLYCGGANEVVCNGFVLSSNSATTLYDNEAAGVTYNWVVESDDSTFANGGIERSYLTQGTLLGYPLVGEEIPDKPAEMYNYMNGVDTQTIYFNKDKAIVKKVKNYYSTDSRINDAQHENYIARQRYEKVLVGPAWDENDFLHLDLSTYSVQTRWDHLDSTITYDYDLANNKTMITKTWFDYGNTNNIQPTVKYTQGSDQIILKDEMKYPTDLAGTVTVCSTLVANNITEPVMEVKSYKNTKLLYQSNTDYKDWFNNGTILQPELLKGQKGTNNPETRIRYYQYDNKGNPLELSKENDVRLVYIWDYNGTLPIAEVSNASWGQGVAYTSFEADGKGGWTFTGTPVTETTEPAGKKSYLLSNGNITYSGTLTASVNYHVSYWAKGTVNVNGSAGTSMLVKNGWTLYRKTIAYSGSGGITISGSGYVDELRLYPDKAFMKTFSHTPEIGTSATADENNLYQQFEYDVFNRLLRVRDMDKNIVKQYEYKLGNSVVGCSNFSANWQPTGNYRCAKNNAVNNNNTGIREREELDINNCSATYGQLQWISVGTSTECPVTANCSGPDKRVINGVCYTGCKVLVASKYIGNLTWECIFHYYWQQDGFTGVDFMETSSYHCQVPFCEVN